MKRKKCKKCKMAKFPFAALRPRYSGELSEDFWARVGALNDPREHYALYCLGVVLQNLEGSVLTALRDAEEAKT